MQAISILLLVLLFVIFGMQKVGQVGDSFQVGENADYEAMHANDEIVVVDRVIDGDTVSLRDGRVVRLIGINTPERGEQWYEQARAFLSQRLTGRTVSLQFEERKEDDYGRVLAHIFLNKEHINAQLIAFGHGKVMMIPPNTYYKNLFKSLYSQAKKEKIGMWSPEPSERLIGTERISLLSFQYDAPGEDNEALGEEFFVLQNNGNTALSLLNWYVMDASGRRYVFKDIVLDPDDTITVRTGVGVDTDTDVFWNQSIGVWNNGGDTLSLIIPSGAVELQYSYGI